MAGLKEIKRRLVSVKNTKKITYAMKLVSAAKLRKAQEAVQKSRAYSDELHNLLVELVQEVGSLDFSHPLLEVRAQVKKVGIIVIGGSRGLCGGYNTNINKKIEFFYNEQKKVGITDVSSTLVNKKPAEYYRRVHRKYLRSYENLSEDAIKWPVDEFCGELEKDYINGEVDEVYMIYTKFKSALSQTVMLEKILPMDAALSLKSETASAPRSAGVTKFEPSVEDVFSSLIPRILRSRVRQACLDAKASEFGSRMTAMESATKNAGDLIRKLQLLYNKLRQSRITSELLDILGGAEAIS